MKNIEKLYLLSKEASSKNVIEAYHEKTKIINKFIISSIIQTDKIVNILRRELRNSFENIKVDSKTISNIIVNDILKRDLVDSEEAKFAMKQINKIIKKKMKKKLTKKQIQQIWHNLTKGMPNKVDFHIEVMDSIYEED